MNGDKFRNLEHQITHQGLSSLTPAELEDYIYELKLNPELEPLEKSRDHYRDRYLALQQRVSSVVQLIKSTGLSSDIRATILDHLEQ